MQKTIAALLNFFIRLVSRHLAVHIHKICAGIPFTDNILTINKMNKNAKIIKYHNSDRLIKKYIERLKLKEIEEKFD